MARRLRLVVRGAVVLLLAAGLYGFLPRVVGLAEQASVLRSANPWVATAAALVQVVSIALYVVAFQRILAEMGARRPFGTVFRAWTSGFFVGHVAVGGTAAGFVVTVEAMRDAGVDRETTSEAVGVMGLLEAGGTVTVLGLGLVLTAGTGVPGAARPAVALAVTAVVAVGVLAVLGARHPDRVERAALRLARLPGVRRIPVEPAELGAAGRRVAERLRLVLRRRRFAVTVLPVVGEVLLDATSLALFLVAVGHPPPLGPFLIASGVATLVGTLPLTPSGLGLVEGALIGLFIGFGTPAPAAVAAVLAYRLVDFWLPLPVGAASYASVVLGRRRRREGAATA
jgi:uncharacterized protein (TIRG00374 family)